MLNKNLQKNKQKGFVDIVLAIVLVLLVSGVSYFAWQKKEAVNKPHVNAASTDWKTYSSAQYGFEIKYPSDWVLGDVVKNPFLASTLSKFNESDETQAGTWVKIARPIDLSSLPVSFRDKWITDLNQESNFTVDGSLAVTEIKRDNQVGYIKYIKFIHENQYYSIDMIWTAAGLVDDSTQDFLSQDKLNAKKIFSQIPFTFKFTK